MSKRKLIQHGTLITPKGKKEADILIVDGVIQKIESKIRLQEEEEVDEYINAAGCFVYPEFTFLDGSDSTLPSYIKEEGVTLRSLTDPKRKAEGLFSLITGQKKYLLMDSLSSEEVRYAPSVFMHLMGDGMDPYGYMELLCANPARALREYPRKGALEVGSSGQVVVWDPNVKFTIKDVPADSRLYSMTGVGQEVQ